MFLAGFICILFSPLPLLIDFFTHFLHWARVKNLFLGHFDTQISTWLLNTVIKTHWIKIRWPATTVCSFKSCQNETWIKIILALALACFEILIWNINGAVLNRELQLTHWTPGSPPGSATHQKLLLKQLMDVENRQRRDSRKYLFSPSVWHLHHSLSWWTDWLLSVA